MELLTIAFMIYYGVQMFYQHRWFKQVSIKLQSKGGKIKEYNEQELKETIKFLFGLVFLLALMPLELWYISNAFAVAKTVTLIYFLFWIAVFVVGNYRRKKNKAKDKPLTLKWSLWQFFVYLIDFLYFGYMFYILFLATN